MATINRRYSTKMENYYPRKSYHPWPSLVKASRVITLDKLISTGIYRILISRVPNKPSSNICFENLCNDYNTDSTAICMLPHLIAYNTYMQSFQDNILNNVLFINKNLHTYGIKPSLYVLFVIYTMKSFILRMWTC